jgi:TonB family protein
MKKHILFVVMLATQLSYANHPKLEGESNFDHKMVENAINIIKMEGPDGDVICKNVKKISAKIIRQKIVPNQNVYSEELWKLYGCDATKYVIATLHSNQLIRIQETEKPIGKYPSRNSIELSHVMDQHKGAIYLLYNRALRKNPTLEGKVIIKMVIDNFGHVIDATIVSSELKDTELEAAILRRIRAISFPPSEKLITTANYKYNFSPK